MGRLRQDADQQGWWRICALGQVDPGVGGNARGARTRRRRGGDEPQRTDERRAQGAGGPARSEEHTSELQSLMRISYAVFCLNTKTRKPDQPLMTSRHLHILIN